MCRRSMLAALLMAAALVGRPGLAKEPLGGVSGPVELSVIPMRTGDHPGFGRVVFDLPAGVAASVAVEAERMVVRFNGPAGAVALTAGPRLPRNVTSIQEQLAQVTLTLAPGARLSRRRIGDRLVFDVADPATAHLASPSQSRRAVTAPELALHADLTRGQAPDARYRAAVAAPPPQSQSGSVTAPSDAGTALPTQAKPRPIPTTLGIAATAGPAARAEPQSRSIILPFGPSVGAAAMRRGDVALVVFDDRRPIDMALLRSDPAFSSASITVLPTATLLRLSMPIDQELRLVRVAGGWMVSLVAADAMGPNVRPIRPELQAGRLHLPAEAPGQVVSVPDPLTGASLLVGTQRADGQGVPVERRTPEFALLATWQGVAVVPLTDALTLRPLDSGFVLATDVQRSLAVSATDNQTLAMTEAARASRHFDLPALPTDALHRRLQSATLAAASARPQARTARRRDVAEAMLALGMGAEMQAVLALAVVEDARAGEDRDIIALAAIAALLAGRDQESAGIEDPSLTGTDEIAMWRAVRMARHDEAAPRAAAIFASAMPLLLSYPAPLRDRLLPSVLETMARGGEHDKAASVLERLPMVSGLDLARGVATERRGGLPAPALAIYDRVASGPDRLARAIAARQAIELRLANGMITIPEAAATLERLSFAWRGDQREVDLRLRVAELNAHAGAWRAAMAVLRDMQQSFPHHEALVRARLIDIFARSLDSPALSDMPAIELVNLVEDNSDLIPEGEAGRRLASRLAERLMALDLPQRAVDVLEKLIADVPSGPARAALGARLAASRMQQGDAKGALAALSATLAEGQLPMPLLESRTLTFARAAAASGDLAVAVNALRDLATPAAHELRASLLEAAKDWPGASAALADHIAVTLPPSDPLDEPQARLVLRLASAASQAGDDATLAMLRSQQANRMPEGELRDLFHLLTAMPVQSIADLPRAAREMRLARSMPESLRAFAAPR